MPDCAYFRAGGVVGSRFRRLEFSAHPEAVATNMTLCVPLSWSDDRSTFLRGFVPSLFEQTVQPAELGIALSNAPAAVAEELRVALAKRFRGHVFVSSAEGPTSPGENRNRCAKLARGEIISFFDADDLMHTRRVEILDQVFRAYRPKAVIHAYAEPKFGHRRFLGYPGASFWCRGLRGPAYNLTETFGGTIPPVAQGWPTVSREVFMSGVSFISAGSGEDARFLQDVLARFGGGPDNGDPLVYLELGLGVYSNAPLAT